MKKTYILLSTVCCSLMISGRLEAQCVSTQDCRALGYTVSSCSGGKGLKCPFGNSWYCPCDSTYIYTCTRANESPSSAKCGDKYSMCNCATGFTWKEDGCKADRASCAIGWIYYADGTCVTPAAHNTSKVALGVVVYVNPDGIGGQVMSAWPVDANGNKSNSNVNMYWSTEYVDISSLPNYTSRETAMTDFNSCSNTDKIVAQGNASTYPAAWAARKYAPTTETKGKWCLPAAGIMTSIYNNQSAVQAGISKLGGVTYPSCCTWSSSEHANRWAWYSSLGSTDGLSDSSKDGNQYVRPVLAF